MAHPDTSVASTFMNVRPIWVEDDAVSECKRCNAAFSLFNRKHHCRNCGNIFCASCSSKEIKIPKLSYKQEVRVCEDCYLLLSRHNI